MKKLSRQLGLRSQKSGFTLVEVLIAASIFTVVSLIAVTVFVNVIRIQRRVVLENAIYEDSRVMMERISREVRENTVDYEEYYNKSTDQDSSAPILGDANLNGKNPYGFYFGCYAQRFYNPGSAGTDIGKFGALCSVPPGPPDANPGCIIDKTTLDINTGQSPFAGSLGSPAQETANAFCDKSFDLIDPQCGDVGDPVNHNLQDELYLINSQGTEKTIFALKDITTTPPPGTTPGTPAEHALALLKLDGQDVDPEDGIDETWRGCNTNPADLCCANGFDCSSLTNLEDSLKYNASNIYKGFVPISPSRTDVVALNFYVAPLEDPRKAFAETSTAADVQQQPHVTIVLTVRPSAAELSGYDGDIPTITLQTTVTSRVYNEVKSYYSKPGVSNACGTNY